MFAPSPSPPAKNRSPRFVLVNDRVPRLDANCALCSAKIETGYVRDPQTRRVYCDAQCFAGRSRMTWTALVSRPRRVS
jgi:hypothetical protein